jgi:hypothetical protein
MMNRNYKWQAVPETQNVTVLGDKIMIRVPTDRQKNQALSRTLFDLSNDHLTTLLL